MYVDNKTASHTTPLLTALGLRAATQAEARDQPAAPVTTATVDPALLTGAVAHLQAASRATAAASPALTSAVDKLQRAAEAFAGDSLVDALGALMLAQSKHTAQRCTLAKGSITGNFRRLEQENIKEIKLIKERIEDARSSGLFDVIGKIFKAIGAAFTAVAGVVSGNPLLLTGAALLTTSFVTGCVGGEVGNMFSLVTGLAGAACSIGGALWNPNMGAVSGLAKALESSSATTRAITTAGQATCGAGAGGADLGKGICDANVQSADANILELRGRMGRLRRQIDDERELMRDLREAADRGVSLVLKVITSHERATAVAVCGGASR